MRLTRTPRSSKNSSCSSSTHQKKAEAIRIDAKETWAIACLVDGKHFVSGGKEGKIRRWRVEDDQEVGMPMDAKSPVLNIAVSQDGQWVVSGPPTRHTVTIGADPRPALAPSILQASEYP